MYLYLCVLYLHPCVLYLNLCVLYLHLCVLYLHLTAYLHSCLTASPQRIRLSAETLLVEANSRAKLQGKKAFVLVRQLWWNPWWKVGVTSVPSLI